MSAPITGTLDPTTGNNYGYTGDLQGALQRRSAVITLLVNCPTGPYIETEKGRTISLTAYRKSLLDELKDLDELIPILGGPWMVSERR